MSYSETGAGSGCAALKGAQPRDTPQAKSLFDLTLDLQLETHRLRDLTYALRSVIAVLSEAPGVSSHPGVSSADTLIKDLDTALLSHQHSLENLEMRRFQARQEVA